MHRRRSEYSSYDLVWPLIVGLQMPNYELMMRDAEACLKPSGVIIFIDGDTKMYLEDNATSAPVALDADEPGGPIEGSWFQRLGRGVSSSNRIFTNER
jgi:hypothetical protein